MSSLWCLHLLPHTTAPRSISLPGAVLLDRSSADVAGWEGRTKLIDPGRDIKIWLQLSKEARAVWRCEVGFPHSCSGFVLVPCGGSLAHGTSSCLHDCFCLQQGKAQWTIYAISWVISYCNVLCSSPQHQQCTTASFPCRAGDIYNPVGKNPFHWPGCSNIYSQGSTSDRGEDVTMGHVAHHLAFQTSSWQSQGC